LTLLGTSALDVQLTVEASSVRVTAHITTRAADARDVKSMLESRSETVLRDDEFEVLSIDAIYIMLSPLPALSPLPPPGAGEAGQPLDSSAGSGNALSETEVGLVISVCIVAAIFAAICGVALATRASKRKETALRQAATQAVRVHSASSVALQLGGASPVVDDTEKVRTAESQSEHSFVHPSERAAALTPMPPTAPRIPTKTPSSKRRTHVVRVVQGAQAPVVDTPAPLPDAQAAKLVADADVESRRSWAIQQDWLREHVTRAMGRSGSHSRQEGGDEKDDTGRV